jgi:hypothetical protein
LEGMRTTPREVQDRRLTQEQEAVLTGTLLGDGSLPIHGRNPRLFVKHKLEHETLALFKYEVFREFISMAPHRFDQRLNGRGYPCVQFVTRTSATFSAWRRRFYPEAPKGCPSRYCARPVTPCVGGVAYGRWCGRLRRTHVPDAQLHASGDDPPSSGPAKGIRLAYSC